MNKYMNKKYKNMNKNKKFELKALTYIKTNSVFGLSKYSCIRKISWESIFYFSMKIKNSDH